MKREALWALVVTVLLLCRNWIQGQLHLLQQGALDASTETAALMHALEALLAGPAALAFVLFSRIRPAAVMHHATRTRIRELVRERPGLGLSDVAGTLGLGWGTTVYHVNRMEAAGLLSSASSGRRRALFLPEHGRTTREAISLLSSDAQVRLLSHVQERPGCSQRELAAAANVSLPLAHRYMRRLEDEGLVASQKSWRTRAYQPTPALREYLAVYALRQKGEQSIVDETVSLASAAVSPSGTNMF
ncbi:MAG TPA: winged helix-turn-helix transcriptional regulator [Candidatus Thermoplasmatota archaeon]|nr:winged helix-turn-helix transcriptional regulator [Candidatus Thermoplasmatota archaeon]